ncbi:MAG: hypothetical protein LQ347_005765 [Umbilicaria vellea]|nr:MAG: hypothetical protein LQ347_005765 [Umbilicaria vellea]
MPSVLALPAGKEEAEEEKESHTHMPSTNGDFKGELNGETAPLEAASSEDVNKDKYPTGWRLWIIIISLLFGTLLIAIDNTIIGTVIPKISTIFKALENVGWYGSAYLLTVTALQPTFGVLYKYFDVKLTYLASIIVFEAGSILCAAAPNSTSFILGRAIAGCGSAGILQGALAIIGIVVPLPKRPLYFGIVLSGYNSNLPIGGAACFMVLFFLRVNATDNENRQLPLRTRLQHLDALGAVTLIAAICCLLLALQWGGTTYPWKSSKIIGLFIGFGLLAIVFGLLQWKLGENATVPLRLLRQRSVLMGCFYAALINMANYTYAYYIPFYFQAARDVSATTSGIRFIPLALPEVVAIVLSGAVTSATGYYVPIMIFSVVVAAVGGGLLTTLNLYTSTAEWAAYLVVTGFGLGIGLQQPFTVIQAVLLESDVPIGNVIPSAIALSIGQTILTNGLAREVPKAAPTISPKAVFNIGATNLAALTTDPKILKALRGSYSQAVVNVLYFALGIVVFALPFALALEWKNVKRVSAQRIQEESGTEISR